jgi:hypothetical protein
MFLIILVIDLRGFSDDGRKVWMLFYRLVVPIKDEMLQIREKWGNSLFNNSKFKTAIYSQNINFLLYISTNPNI